MAVIGLIIITLAPSLIHAAKAFKLSGNEGADNIALSENRALAGRPAAADSFTDYTRNIDNYLDDHFGLRALAIKAQRVVQRNLGGGKTPVYEGKDGWLFLGDEVVWENHQGRSRFTAQNIKGYFARLAALKQRADQDGIAFAATIAPDKASIYPEKAPPRFGKKSSRNFLESVMGQPSKDQLGLIDVRPALLAKKETVQIYYKTDTHWTGHGAYAAYRQLMQPLKRARPDIAVTLPKALRAQTVSEFSGDLTKIGGRTEMNETYKKLKVKRPRAFKKQLLERSTLNESWHSHIYVRSGPLPDKPRKIVLLGDSFSLHYIDFLKPNFDEIIFIHHKNGQFTMNEIFSHKPDAIIFTVVERFSQTISPP